MLELDNRTRFDVGLLPSLDVAGCEHATVVIKGRFSFADGDNPDPLEPSPEPAVLAYADAHYGEPGESSVRYESDVAPAKRFPEIVLLGHAYAPARRTVTATTVALAVEGRWTKTVSVTGDRVWTRRMGHFVPSDPVPFERMPLTFERAYGGAEPSASGGQGAHEPRNPVGRGFTTARDRDRLEGLPLANLEAPGALVSSPLDRAQPTAFAWIGRAWAPRVAYAGTYDAMWAHERSPLLPLDFDRRFFQGAPPDQACAKPLHGGEEVRVNGATPSGRLRLYIPRRRLSVIAVVRNQRRDLAPELDTVVVEPDEGTLTAVWRTTFACPRQFVNIDYVRVKEAA